MRALMLLSMVLLSSQAAVADDKCFGGSSTAFTATDWSAAAVDDSTIDLSFSIVSHLKKAVRMIDVETGFVDALGKPMGAFRFGSDYTIAAGEKFTFHGQIGSLVVPRLLAVKHEDAVPYVCTAAVIYADGTKDTFK